MSSDDHECRELLDCFDDVWSCFDQLFATFGASEWSSRHGNDWEFADLPYHLAYFDHDVIAVPLEKGDKYPAEDRWLMQSLAEIAGWNRVKFDERSIDQTVEQSVEQWHTTREAIRLTLKEMTDADLDTIVFFPFTGTASIRELLQVGIAHSWGHLTEARNRLDRDQPVPTSATRNIGAGFNVSLLSLMANTSASTIPFELQLDFPSLSSWHITVTNSGSTAEIGQAEGPDLTMTLTPELLFAIMNGLQNPMTAILTRKVKIKGIIRLPAFGKVFPQPGPDDLVFPRPESWRDYRIYH